MNSVYVLAKAYITFRIIRAIVLSRFSISVAVATVLLKLPTVEHYCQVQDFLNKGLLVFYLC